MNNIKVLREKSEMAQVELAARLGISQQSVAKWETGDSLPRADKLPELARLLGCTVDELLAKEEK